MKYDDGPCTLSNASFSLEKGSLHFLTGVSGAGKSSLLKLIFADHLPQQGSVEVFGEDTRSIPYKRLPFFRQKIGIVFQDFNLIESLSVMDNVTLPLLINGFEEYRARNNAKELLSWVGLESNFEAMPRQLSGGEKQRVSIARAVISQPDVLLADEPTGNVDDKLAIRLLYLFEELNRMGTTVLIATHSYSLAKQFNFPILKLENQQVFKS